MVLLTKLHIAKELPFGGMAFNGGVGKKKERKRYW
jgi:hypothetical protein